MIGREQELKDLREHLSNQQQVVLVNGMGGIGKTALAQTYATFYRKNYEHIAWVQQTSDDFRQDLISAEGLLDSLNLSTTGTVEELFPKVINKLRSIESQPNLLVIDNAFVSLTKIKDQLPKQPHWHILITSREEIAGFELKELGFLSEAAAIDLFKRHYSLTKLQNADIAILVKRLDYHTLTIELLAKIAQRKRATLEDLLTAIEKDVNANVHINHALSDEKVERIRSYLCSIFKADKLSEPETYLLKQLTCLPTEFHTYEILEELLDVKQEFDITLSEILENLKESGWLIADSKNDSYKMHQVIQMALFTQLNVKLDDVDFLIENINDKLYLDDTKDNPIDKFPWIPFGQTIEGLLNESTDDRVSTLQNNLALTLGDRGDLQGAKNLLEKAMISNEKNFGEDHPNTARCYSNLGLVLQNLGDLQGAKTLLKKAMLAAEKNFGEDHPTTAIRYSNLGSVLIDLSDFQGAKTLLEKAMISDEKNFGEDHPNTARCYSNLGLVLQNLGDLQGAKTLLKKAMLAAEKNFGEDHPTTAIRYSNLGSVLIDLSDFQGAKTLLEKAMISDEKNFGEDHPYTAINCSNLGIALQNLGDFQEAKTLLEKAMVSDEKNFGEDHPYTARNYSNLGIVLKDLGDLLGAKALLEKAMISGEKNFGEDHPITAIRYSNLGGVLQDLGDLQGAKTLLEKARISDEKNLGKDHPSTGSSYHNLATLLYELQDYQQAYSLIEKALEILKNTYPEGHPHIERALSWYERIESKLNN
nr:tetratricopeptide repeat protein [Sessilibacter corallicola]